MQSPAKPGLVFVEGLLRGNVDFKAKSIIGWSAMINHHALLFKINFVHPINSYSWVNVDIGHWRKRDRAAGYNFCVVAKITIPMVHLDTEPTYEILSKTATASKLNIAAKDGKRSVVYEFVGKMQFMVEDMTLLGCHPSSNKRSETYATRS